MLGVGVGGLLLLLPGPNPPSPPRPPPLPPALFESHPGVRGKSLHPEFDNSLLSLAPRLSIAKVQGLPRSPTGGHVNMLGTHQK